MRAYICWDDGMVMPVLVGDEEVMPSMVDNGVVNNEVTITSQKVILGMVSKVLFHLPIVDAGVDYPDQGETTLSIWHTLTIGVPNNRDHVGSLERHRCCELVVIA